MILKGIIDTDFINYKKICMVLESPICDFKCDKECGNKVCQNSPLAHAPNHNISIERIIKMYTGNPITEAVLFQGLEPLDSFEETLDFIKEFRKTSNDDIVIYTGYNKDEVQEKIKKLQQYKNIIVKFGRYIPNKDSRYDETLGVKLASDNQCAERIS